MKKGIPKINTKKLIDTVLKTDWGFSDADTKKLTHEIHRYSGKYIPQIAKQAIELISFPGELVLDPYVGSGTTLLEANLSGRKSAGIDLNPLAVLISEVKTTPIHDDKLNSLLAFFEEIQFKFESKKRGQKSLLGDDNNSLNFEASLDKKFEDVWYTKWFNKKILEELITLEHFIQLYSDKNCRNLAKVAFSNVLRKCSNAHSGYPNVMLDKEKNNKTSPISIFIKTLKEDIEKVRGLSKNLNQSIEMKVIYGSATQIPFEDSSVDSIVTHPPYIGSVPYAEYGSLSLKWLGFEPKEIDGKLTGGKRQSKDVVQRFIKDYKCMLSESYRVLKANRCLFILIGDPTVKGEFIDLAKMTKDLSLEIGFKLLVEKKRSGVNRRANKMGHETILFFQK